MSYFRASQHILVFASLAIAMLAGNFGCDSSVEYKSPEDSASQKGTPWCSGATSPQNCASGNTCDASVQNGTPCSKEGQTCQRSEFGCVFQATCMMGTWFGGTTCSGGSGMSPPPDVPPDPQPGCISCTQFISEGSSAGPLCDKSAFFVKDLLNCLCGQSSMGQPPGCAEVCSDNLCITDPMMPTDACATCAQNSCQAQLNACINE